MESIFDLAISSSGKILYKGRPLVPVYTEEFDQLHIIFCCPLVSTDIGIKSFIPTFTALLSDSSRKTVGYCHPITRAYIFDPLHKNLVFFLAPTAMSDDMAIVVKFKPPIVALNFWHTHQFTYLVPRLCTKLLDKDLKFLIPL